MHIIDLEEPQADPPADAVRAGIAARERVAHATSYEEIDLVCQPETSTGRSTSTTSG